MMFCAVIFIIIHTENEGDILIFCRSCDNHFLRPAFFDMHPGASFAFGGVAIGIGENTGGFDHDIHTEIFPGQCRWILFSEYPD